MPTRDRKTRPRCLWLRCARRANLETAPVAAKDKVDEACEEPGRSKHSKPWPRHATLWGLQLRCYVLRDHRRTCFYFIEFLTGQTNLRIDVGASGSLRWAWGERGGQRPDSSCRRAGVGRFSDRARVQAWLHTRPLILQPHRAQALTSVCRPVWTGRLGPVAPAHPCKRRDLNHCS